MHMYLKVEKSNQDCILSCILRSPYLSLHCNLIFSQRFSQDKVPFYYFREIETISSKECRGSCKIGLIWIVRKLGTLLAEVNERL